MADGRTRAAAAVHTSVSSIVMDMAVAAAAAASTATNRRHPDIVQHVYVCCMRRERECVMVGMRIHRATGGAR